MRIHKTYLFLAAILFVLEVIIALYIHDNFIRPYFGDFLVVIFLYCFLMAFFNFKREIAAFFVLLFSYVVEALQFFNFIQIIGLENNKLAKIVLGSSFSWLDLFWYTAGIIFVLLLEKTIAQRKQKSTDLI